MITGCGCISERESYFCYHQKKKNMYKQIFAFLLFLLSGCYGMAQGVIYADNEQEHYRKVQEWRQRKDSLYRIPGQTMLPDDLLKDFTGLNYYPIDYSYRVKGRLARYYDGRTVTVKTSGLRTVDYLIYGKVTFNLRGKEHSLDVYQSKRAAERGAKKGALLILFYDETSGDTTYGGGRYLVLDVPEGDELTLDFNMAYNPYCVYDPEHVCPLPPPQNSLAVRVEAGEKMYP